MQLGRWSIFSTSSRTRFIPFMLGPLLQKEKKIPIGPTGLVKPQKVLSDEVYPSPWAI